MDIKKIKPYPRNAKKHDKRQISLIAESIKRFGFDSPIILDKNNEVIAGHGRLEAAKFLGLTEVPTISKEELTEEEVRAYRLADNKIAESEWDMGLATEELKGLSPELFDLTGFDRDLLIEPDEKDDIIPDNAPTRAKLGDIWALGRHRVMCGDSTDKEAVARLMEGKMAQLVYSDPPYGVAYDGGVGSERDDKYKDDFTNYRQFLIEIYNNAFLVSDDKAPLMIWYASKMTPEVLGALDESGYSLIDVLIWNKPNAHYGALNCQYKIRYEPCIYAVKKKKTRYWYGDSTRRNLIDVDQPTKNDLHPTMKPIALYEYFIPNHTKRGEIIYEPFGGSGTTLIACEKTNRICYGMEIDPKYVDVILKRWEDYTNGTATKL